MNLNIIGITFGVNKENKLSPVCQCGNGNKPYSQGFFPYTKRIILLDKRGRKKEVSRPSIICAECHLDVLLTDFKEEYRRVQEELNSYAKKQDEENNKK